MREIVIYTTSYCPYCFAAKALLRAKKVPFKEIDVTNDASRREEMDRLSGRKTVPQIFIDGKPVGGFDDLRELDQRAELDPMLGITK